MTDAQQAAAQQTAGPRTAARRTLVLHLSGGGEPVRLAVSAQTAEQLAGRLPKLLLADTPQLIETADGTPAVVNFAHVAAALLTAMQPTVQVYGNAH
jgi:hypothetical protein